MSRETQYEVEQFLYRQAEILAERDWQAWLDLFTPEGIYWMPADPAHTSDEGVPSIFREDRWLRLTRTRRLENPKAWSQSPQNRTSTLVGNVAVLSDDGLTITSRARFHTVEQRMYEMRYFAGRYEHSLVRTEGGLRIQRQRVDLLSYDAPIEFVLQFWL